MGDFEIGEYIIYVNGDKYELGRITSLKSDGAFVCYHEGETAAKTPYHTMHKLINRYCISKTTLGGDRFNEAQDPTAEAEPVKHGYWINDKGLYKCSVCNNFTITGWASCIPIEYMNKTMKYCNNCGARMDEVKK